MRVRFLCQEGLTPAVSLATDRFFLQTVQAIGTSVLRDRKSTRLNSSHITISYAVFCLKKKKKNINKNQHAQTKRHKTKNQRLITNTTQNHKLHIKHKAPPTTTKNHRHRQHAAQWRIHT